MAKGLPGGRGLIGSQFVRNINGGGSRKGRFTARPEIAAAPGGKAKGNWSPSKVSGAGGNRGSFGSHGKSTAKSVIQTGPSTT